MPEYPVLDGNNDTIIAAAEDPNLPNAYPVLDGEGGEVVATDKDPAYVATPYDNSGDYPVLDGLGAEIVQSSGTPAPTPAPPEFGTVALGIAGVADNDPFMVQQIDADGYHLTYIRRGTEAEFTGWRAESAAAIANEAVISAKVAAYAGLPSTGKLLITEAAKRSGGRGIPNINSAVPWTLNMVSARHPRDEEGNTTPTRTTGFADPTGGNNAVRLSYASVTHNLEVIGRSVNPGIPTTDFNITYSAYVTAVSGASDIQFGVASAGNANSTETTPDGTWQQLPGYIDDWTSIDMGMIPARNGGETLPAVVDATGFFVAGDTGPLVVPALADLYAEEDAGHAKAAVGHVGAVPLDANGWVRPTADLTNVLLPLARNEVTEFSMLVWVDFAKTNYGGTFVASASFMNTPDTGTATVPNQGGLGLDVAGGGRLYNNPALSTTAGRSPSVVLGQGATLLAVDYHADGTTTPRINGVPLFVGSEAVASVFAEFVSIGGMDLSRRRKTTGDRAVQTPDGFGDFGFYDSVLTDAQHLQFYNAGAAYFAAGQKKMALTAGFDSITQATSSAIWAASSAAELTPGTHFMMDAIGGSRHSDGVTIIDSNYDSPVRQGLRQRALAMQAATHEKVIYYAHFGVNDLVSGPMDPNLGQGWFDGSRIIDAMIQADILSVPAADRGKIETVLIPVLPVGGWAVAGAAAADVDRENARIAYRSDCLNNYSARGYDFVLDYEATTLTGFASMQAAAIDAFQNNGNTFFESDGLHPEPPACQAFADQILVPFLEARLLAAQA